jgi:2-polyprenyl-6-methoxyphenol hydroxylase-like FAD-dependent oxidoreductase
VLEAIGASSALDGGHRAYARETRDARDKTINSIRWDKSSRLRLVTVTRERLHGALVDAANAAGATIVTGSEAVAVHPDGTLILAGGTRIKADLVVGADGVRSNIRHCLGLMKRHTVLPDGAIRLMIPRLPEEAHSEDGRKYIE